MSDNTTDWLTHQRAINWAGFHPEAFCHKCGGLNLTSWHAPNALWKESGLADKYQGIVCPQCFVMAIETKRGAYQTWRLDCD